MRQNFHPGYAVYDRMLDAELSSVLAFKVDNAYSKAKEALRNAL
jgi:hypothetical protein